MIKAIVYFSFIFLLSNVAKGQYFAYPSYDSKTEKDLIIVSVTREASSTIIEFECKISTPPGRYIFLNSPNTQGAYYIKAAGKIYKLLATKGISNNNRETEAVYNQPVYFTATFEAIPKNITEFDLVEGANGTWNFYGIKLRGSSTSQPSISSSNRNNSGSTPAYNNTPNISEACDKITFTPASSKPTIESFLKGVKYALINEATNNTQVPMINALSNYVFDLGLIKIPSIKDIANYDISLVAFIEATSNFEYKIGNNNKIYSRCYDIKIFFSNPKFGYEWAFSTKQETWAITDQELTSQYYKCLQSAYNNTSRGYFNSSFTLKPAKRKTCWTEQTIKQLFKSKGVDNIEGIYQASGSTDEKYRLALKKINSIYHLIYLSGAASISDWDEGEIKAILEPSATPLLYNAKWVMANKEDNNNCYITFEQGLMNVYNNNSKTSYIKLFPSVDDVNSSPSTISASGSGFAISSNGLIVTNNHVIEGAKNINVRGVNGDFNKTYSAKVIITDKNNDLSIIKIIDENFSNLGPIPYVIKTSPSDVGENVFILGYPLRASMGDEIKLTNGIVSSKSGYQGDITSYQISAPAQPGNSGGPLFSGNGSLIGVVNAKNTEAENASYAVKSNYLINLINSLDTPPSLQKVSSLIGKPLTQQVQIIKKYVYIIETN